MSHVTGRMWQLYTITCDKSLMNESHSMPQLLMRLYFLKMVTHMQTHTAWILICFSSPLPPRRLLTALEKAKWRGSGKTSCFGIHFPSCLADDRARLSEQLLLIMLLVKSKQHATHTHPHTELSPCRKH